MIRNLISSIKRLINYVINLIVHPFRPRYGDWIHTRCITLTSPSSRLMDMPNEEYRLNAIIHFESGSIPPLGHILSCTLSEHNYVGEFDAMVGECFFKVIERDKGNKNAICKIIGSSSKEHYSFLLNFSSHMKSQPCFVDMDMEGLFSEDFTVSPVKSIKTKKAPATLQDLPNYSDIRTFSIEALSSDATMDYQHQKYHR